MAYYWLLNLDLFQVTVWTLCRWLGWSWSWGLWRLPNPGVQPWEPASWKRLSSLHRPSQPPHLNLTFNTIFVDIGFPWTSSVYSKKSPVKPDLHLKCPLWGNSCTGWLVEHSTRKEGMRPSSASGCQPDSSWLVTAVTLVLGRTRYTSVDGTLREARGPLCSEKAHCHF